MQIANTTYTYINLQKMGAKVSTLLFRPPKPTQMSEENYFYLDVDVVTPLTVPGVEGGPCGTMGCVSNPDSDLASLDSSFLDEDNSNNNRYVRNGNHYKVPVFFIRRRNATQTILFSHGNAEDLGMMFERMKELAKKLSVNIMAYDYTGYGMSLPRGEKPSENMCYRNIDAAYEYLTQVRKCPPSSIILYGRSLGGGPSCYLAAKTAMQGHSVGGLILHSAFLSVFKVVTDMNGLDMRLVGDMFNNEKRAKNIRCPTITIHGKRDVVVPFWHAPRLLGSIPSEYRWKPMFVEDLGHNSIESKKRLEYVDALTDFINGIRIMKEMNAPIQREYRASAEDVQDNVNFYVNKMWLKHAKLALIEALVGKKSSSSKAASASGNSVESSNSELHNRSTLVLNSRGRTYDPSAFENHNTSAKIHTRSFSGAGGQFGTDDFPLSDARDEEDEFAPWKEEREEETTHHSASRPSSVTPAEELTTLAIVRTSTRQSGLRSESSIDKPSSSRARQSSSTPTSPRKAPSRSQSTTIATSPRKTPSRSQSTISKAEYSTKRLEAEYFSQQLKRQQELNRQNELMRQYESGRKSNSMQLSATSQRQKRGGRNKDGSMYEM